MTTQDSSGFAPPPPHPVYFGDIDEVLRKVSDHVPIADTDRIYQWELETQRKVYLGLLALGFLMIGFSLMLSIRPT